MKYSQTNVLINFSKDSCQRLLFLSLFVLLEIFILFFIQSAPERAREIFSFCFLQFPSSRMVGREISITVVYIWYFLNKWLLFDYTHFFIRTSRIFEKGTLRTKMFLTLLKRLFWFLTLLKTLCVKNRFLFS